ncbi:hypothetical protein MKW98_011768 [Papaver atlanticum]|uniref:Phytocyanin domain-containing protein n=1 Tax=Papaver atlanticum TaxID=357466 RepID=A0AAD4SPG3_9MAGN|nr:hypothetical protein MKW98_011768 [Papaver atlanticum]
MAAASSMAATYTVGGAADVNYNEWPSSKNFHAGDTLLISSDYESCTATAPLTTYLTGDDFILILGDDDHYYFIRGEPGHCEFGQKVDIQVAFQLFHHLDHQLKLHLYPLNLLRRIFSLAVFLSV